MSKLTAPFIILLLIFLQIAPITQAAGSGSCPVDSVSIPTVYTDDPFIIKVTFNSNFVNLNYDYYVYITDEGHVAADNQESAHKKVPINNPVVEFQLTEGVHRQSQYNVTLKHAENTPFARDVCDLGKLTAQRKEFKVFSQVNNCSISMPNNIKYQDNITATVNIPNVSGVDYHFLVFPISNASQIPNQPTVTNALLISSNLFSQTISPPTGIVDIGQLDLNDYIAVIESISGSVSYFCQTHRFSVTNKNTSTPIVSTPIPPLTSGAGMYGQTATFAAGTPCDYPGEPPKSGISTAIGCVPTSPTGLVNALLKFAVGIGGGIAFLIMLSGAFQMINSGGNPDALKAGQERFKDAIIGLLFVLLSVLILKIIGVDILGLGKAFGL